MLFNMATNNFLYVGSSSQEDKTRAIKRAECKATEGIWGTAAGTAEEIQRGDRGSAGTDITNEQTQVQHCTAS